jgi:hypothetical protein
MPTFNKDQVMNVIHKAAFGAGTLLVALSKDKSPTDPQTILGSALIAWSLKDSHQQNTVPQPTKQ